MDHNSSFFCYAFTTAAMTGAAVAAYGQGMPREVAVASVAAVLTAANAFRETNREISDRLKTKAEPQDSHDELLAAWHRIKHKIFGATATVATVTLGAAAFFMKDPTFKTLMTFGTTLAGMYASHSVADVVADRIEPTPPRAPTPAAASPA